MSDASIPGSSTLPPSPPPPPAPPGPSLAVRILRTLREAVGGSDQDFTQGDLRRGVILLAIPMVLEMAMESVFAVVDVFFVARLGAAHVATVGITEAVLTLIYAVAIGLSMALTALVSRRTGEKDPDGAAVTAFQGILLGVVVSVAFGAAGALLADDLLRWMGAEPEVLAVGTGYTMVMLAGSVTVVELFLINAAFRGTGDAAVAMRSLWLANGLNIVLDPLLIFGLGPFPEMGLTGAAVATTLGRGTGVVYQLVVIARGRGRLAIGRRHLRFDPAILGRLLKVSVGGVLQYLVATASWLVLVRILAIFGSAALAGYTIGVRIIIFVLMPAWGLSNAAATLVGQNLGAGQPDRAERSAWLTAHYNAVFMGVVAVTYLLIPETLMRLFTDDPEVIAVGVSLLRWSALCYPFYAYGLVMTQSLNGAGDTTTPTFINFAAYWAWQIPVAYLLSQPFGWGVKGTFIAVATSEMLLAILGVLAFRRARWKERSV